MPIFSGVCFSSFSCSRRVETVQSVRLSDITFEYSNCIIRVHEHWEGAPHQSSADPS